MNGRNLKTEGQGFYFFRKYSIILKHCFIDIVDEYSYFIVSTHPFIYKIKLFHSIFILFLSYPFQLITIFAFLSTMIHNFTKKSITTKS